MYSGRYSITLDDRSRLRIPTKLREKLGDNVIMCGGSEGCAFLMNEEQLEEFLAPVEEKIKLGDLESMTKLRKFYATVFPMTEDNQGRFVLPATLKKYMKADKKLIFLGAKKRIEIWAEEIFVERFESNVEDINDAVIMLGML